jgi:hypothetical protein
MGSRTLTETSDGQVPCITPRIDCEDAASLILFIDTFLPYLDMKDQDSRDSAVNVFRVREKIHHADSLPTGDYEPITFACRELASWLAISYERVS